MKMLMGKREDAMDFWLPHLLPAEFGGDTV